jgi:hypothetical protein
MALQKEFSSKPRSSLDPEAMVAGAVTGSRAAKEPLTIVNKTMAHVRIVFLMMNDLD